MFSSSAIPTFRGALSLEKPFISTDFANLLFRQRQPRARILFQRQRRSLGGLAQDASRVDDISLEGLKLEDDDPRAGKGKGMRMISTPPPRSRVQSRLERKRRRVEEGKFRGGERKVEDEGEEEEGKFAVSSREGPGDEDGRQRVLEKIEGMEGVGKVSKPAEKKERKKKSETNKESKKPPPPTTKFKEPWQIQKAALSEKFGSTGWAPRKRLSPDTLDGIRALHASDPASYDTATLAQHFKISAEAIRRILKSKWRPNAEEAEDRRRRWEERGMRKWTDMAAQGVRPPAKWRAMGVKQEGARVKEDRYVKWEGDVEREERGGRGEVDVAGRIW